MHTSKPLPADLPKALEDALRQERNRFVVESRRRDAETKTTALLDGSSRFAMLACASSFHRLLRFKLAADRADALAQVEIAVTSKMGSMSDEASSFKRKAHDLKTAESKREQLYSISLVSEYL